MKNEHPSLPDHPKSSPSSIISYVAALTGFDFDNNYLKIQNQRSNHFEEIGFVILEHRTCYLGKKKCLTRDLLQIPCKKK
jgi:hypothetical protein